MIRSCAVQLPRCFAVRAPGEGRRCVAARAAIDTAAPKRHVHSRGV